MPSKCACCAGIVIEPLFNAFATTAFFEFVVFAIFEMRYLLSVWRARRTNALDPWAAQRELSVLYARFYGALLGGIFLTYQLQRCPCLPVVSACQLSVCLGCVVFNGQHMQSESYSWVLAQGESFEWSGVKVHAGWGSALALDID